MMLCRFSYQVSVPMRTTIAVPVLSVEVLLPDGGSSSSGYDGLPPAVMARCNGTALCLRLRQSTATQRRNLEIATAGLDALERDLKALIEGDLAKLEEAFAGAPGAVVLINLARQATRPDYRQMV